ncbi:winged helix-turn-helix domain-containing protein [Phytoactinopolyspora halotolerans]|uniref:Winged helix-turn-helix transcriptional regulator n=1 Tax=Phytoactinopolyspora halotolerans TaxID=1981512 RepID=A0A6L9SGW6_9ACTN|nr:winged helix-turn-helix domain-containing protein [Phytoactinopolyspora halotolerans]NEE03848.1 winged helix-turn-helix transcriptional regulator [Phytoactinopolyspora halotolerans]
MTANTFDPNAGGPGYIYLKLADHVVALIDAGRLRPGAQLWPERQMATRFRVSIGTARRATEELRQRGLVVTLPAKGTYITCPAGPTEPDPEQPSNGQGSR